MNWGAIFAWAGIALSLGASIGYAFAHDWRRSLYYLFAALVTITVVWKG